MQKYYMDIYVLNIYIIYSCCWASNQPITAFSNILILAIIGDAVGGLGLLRGQRGQGSAYGAADPCCISGSRSMRARLLTVSARSWVPMAAWILPGEGQYFAHVSRPLITCLICVWTISSPGWTPRINGDWAWNRRDRTSQGAFVFSKSSDF